MKSNDLACSNSATMTGPEKSRAEIVGRRTAATSPTREIGKRLGRPRLESEPRRQRILLAAAEIFYQRGYDGTTLKAVSEAAGVSKQTIYDLVGDKVAVFRAVCKNAFAERDAFRPSVPATIADLQPSLEEIAQRLIKHSLSDGILTVARAMVIEGIRFPELALDVIGSGKRQISEILAHYFEELAKCKFIGKLDAHEAADLFYDIAVGARGFRKAMGYREPEPANSEIAQRVRVFVAGYLCVVPRPGDSPMA